MPTYKYSSFCLRLKIQTYPEKIFSLLRDTFKTTVQFRAHDLLVPFLVHR